MSTQVILFLAANPHGTQPVKLDSECAAIQRELKLARHRDDFRFESRWAVSIDDLMRHLRELDPTVIHFSGHGGGSAGLMLEDEQGQPQPISARALTKIVAATTRRVRLVVLNACYSAVQAKALCTGVDCVVGMDGAIGDVAARRFAVQLYGALGDRRSVGNAVANGVAVLAAYELPDEALPHCVTRSGVDAQKVYLATIEGGANAVVQVASQHSEPTSHPAVAAGAPGAVGERRRTKRAAVAAGGLVTTIVVAVLALRWVLGGWITAGDAGSAARAAERDAGSAAESVPKVSPVPADARPDAPVVQARGTGTARELDTGKPKVETTLTGTWKLSIQAWRGTVKIVARSDRDGCGTLELSIPVENELQGNFELEHCLLTDSKLVGDLYWRAPVDHSKFPAQMLRWIFELSCSGQGKDKCSASLGMPNRGSDAAFKEHGIATRVPDGSVRSATEPVHALESARASSETTATTPSDGGGCDEVSCMLSGYEGACCTRFRKGKIPAAAAGDGGGGAGKGDLPDSLDRTMISDGVAEMKARVMACGDKSPAKGQVKVWVKVGPDGSVVDIVVRNTPDRALGECVAAMMRQARFAKTQTGGAFAYPFQF